MNSKEQRESEEIYFWWKWEEQFGYDPYWFDYLPTEKLKEEYEVYLRRVELMSILATER